MPELPEAEVVARQLRERLIGATLIELEFGRSDIVRHGIETQQWYAGAVLSGVQRQGKSVVLDFMREDETRYLVAELGMTGLLLFRSLNPRFERHTHARLRLEGGREPQLLYWNPRRFGRLSLLDDAGLQAYCARRFGCDPLTASLDVFSRVFQGRRGRLKMLLMHQQRIAGIGNIYANEILYRTKLHPLRIASSLKPAMIRNLFDTTREVLLEAIACGGSSVRDFFAPDGSEGRYKDRHLVYNKEEQSCPRGCGGQIRRLQGERSSFYCPTCQKK
jgi:formamidopyrimidine-DNA glycosylase